MKLAELTEGIAKKTYRNRGRHVVVKQQPPPPDEGSTWQPWVPGHIEILTPYSDRNVAELYNDNSTSNEVIDALADIIAVYFDGTAIGEDWDDVTVGAMISDLDLYKD